MSQNRGDKIDSDSIRKGLMSIRNSQIELLNELKIETQQLKNTPMRFNTSTEDSHSENNHKNDYNFTFPPENAQSIVKYNPPSPSPADKPYSFGLPTQNQLQNQIYRLKDENKSLTDSVQKLLFNRSQDKERIRELESYLYFNSKIHYQILSQIFNGTPISEVRRGFENDLKMNQDIYCKYQESNHTLVLDLLQQKQMQEQKKTSSGVNPSPRQTQITSQLGELKEQLVMLLKTGQKGDSHVMPGMSADYNRLKEECQVLRKKCQQMQDNITQLNSDNKELALCWQRQISERKSLIKELERAKKDRSVDSELQRQFSFVQTDLEAQLVQAQDIIRQKDEKVSSFDGEIKNLLNEISRLKEQNERIKKQAAEVEKINNALKAENLQASKYRSRQNQAVMRMSQQSGMLNHYQRQNQELKGHLADLRMQFETLVHTQHRQREREAMEQEMQMRRMQVMKTTSTVEHLWQVKRVQFENINQLLRELRDKSVKVE